MFQFSEVQRQGSPSTAMPLSQLYIPYIEKLQNTMIQ